VLAGEGRAELSSLARGRPDERVLEFLHDLVRAYHDGHALAAAPLEFDAVDPADEVDCHAVVVQDATRHFVEHGTLLAQRVDHRFEVVVGDGGDRTFDGEI
jgi:hypothetical protein